MEYKETNERRKSVGLGISLTIIAVFLAVDVYIIIFKDSVISKVLASIAFGMFLTLFLIFLFNKNNLRLIKTNNSSQEKTLRK